LRVKLDLIKKVVDNDYIVEYFYYCGNIAKSL